MNTASGQLSVASLQTEAFSWLRDLVERRIIVLPPWAPPLEHCAGLNKFLGALLGVYLVPMAPSSSWGLCMGISRLGLLVRTHIVLHDRWVDQVRPKDSAVLASCLKSLEDLSVDQIGAMTEDRHYARMLWDGAQKEVHETYAALDGGVSPTFNLVVKKCWQECLPILVMGRLFPGFPVSEAMRVFSEFLFVLQLFDDFCDMEEDLASRTNHNLFVWHLAADDAARLIGARQAWAGELCLYALRGIRDLRRSVDGQTRMCHLAQLLWQCEVFISGISCECAKRAPEGSSLWLTHPRLQDYEVPAEAGEFGAFLARLAGKSVPSADLSRIRAESLHEVSFAPYMQSCLNKVLGEWFAHAQAKEYRSPCQ